MPKVDLADTIARMELEFGRLAGLLRGLPEEAWARPTKCEGWTVRHIAAHLGMGVEFHLEIARRALAGDASPLWGPETWPRRDQELEARQARPSAQLLSELVGRHEQIVDFYRGLAPADLEQPTWHRLGVIPLGWLVAARVGEYAIHRWDIEAVPDPNARIDPGTAPYLVEYLVETLPFRFKPEAAPARPFVARLEIGGPSGRVFNLRAAPDRLTLGATADSADVGFRIDPEAAILLLSGRLPLLQAIASRRLACDGSTEHVRTFAGLIRTF